MVVVVVEVIEVAEVAVVAMVGVVVEVAAVAQSVECASPGEKVPGSINAVAARSFLVGSV